MRKKKPTLYIGVIWGVLLGFSLTLAHNVWAEKQKLSALPLEDLRTFTDVYALSKIT